MRIEFESFGGRRLDSPEPQEKKEERRPFVERWWPQDGSPAGPEHSFAPPHAHAATPSPPGGGSESSGNESSGRKTRPRGWRTLAATPTPADIVEGRPWNASRKANRSDFAHARAHRVLFRIEGGGGPAGAQHSRRLSVSPLAEMFAGTVAHLSRLGFEIAEVRIPESPNVL